MTTPFKREYEIAFALVILGVGSLYYQAFAAVIILIGMVRITFLTRKYYQEQQKKDLQTQVTQWTKIQKK